MPPPLLFDIGAYDLSQVVLTQEEIYRTLPHRCEFMLLDGVTMLDIEAERMIAFADIRPDAWWVRGHIPGRPLLPGVLMIEMAAHAASCYTCTVLKSQEFLAFTALDDCKFRGMVEPPTRLYLLGVGVDTRPRRSICRFQGVVDGKMVFEAQITGIPV
jgi:3-hydroxyacyl-[acyl-carrier-protein] dehydratase